LKSIKKNKIAPLQKKTVVNSTKEAERRKEQSSEYYLQRYLLEKNQYNLTSHFEKKAKNKNITASEDLQSLSKKLDIFYLIEKMKHGADLLTWSIMYKVNIDFTQFEFTSRLIEKSDYLEIPAVNVFYNIYKAFKEETETKYFFEAKKIMLKHLDKFAFYEQQDIYDSMISYCIVRVNNGNKDFIPEALEMYETGVDTGISLINGELSPTAFRNIVIMALRFGYIDFAEEFSNEKIHLVNPRFKIDSLNFNLARVHFYKKNHHKVLEYLSKVNFDDVFYNLNSRSILIATYYELDEIGPLESLLTSFGAFLRREKSIDDTKRKRYLNFVKFVNKLVKLFPITNEGLDKLKAEVTAAKGVINKAWLLEKIELIRP